MNDATGNGEGNKPEDGQGEGRPAGDPLAALRARIDAIDDSIHDLLMQRAAIVTEIGAAKGRGSVLRPGREAQVLRRILARHQGRLPKRALVALWRELFGAFASMQGRIAVAVYAPPGDPALIDLARRHFGGLVPLVPSASMAQTLGRVHDGEATAAVLPLPREGESDPWWRALAGEDGRTPKIIGLLPFAPEPAGSGDLQALVVGTGRPDPSGADASFVLIETGGETGAEASRAHLLQGLAEGGFDPAFVAVWTPRGVPDTQMLLARVDGWVGADDPRLAGLTERRPMLFRRALCIGGYPLPLPRATL